MDDGLVVEMYRRYGLPCDKLVSDPCLLTDFTADYNRQTGSDVLPASMGKRLLNLRRRGQKNGGLPRLFRAYNGRNCQSE
jgi:hypothetical protein